MLQQIIALLIIIYFISRLIKEKNNQEINNKEFAVWLIFWLSGAAAIILIKQIDRLVNWLGFSGSGINFLIYLAVIALFYLVFKLRLKLAKLDSDLTTMTRHVALDNKK